MIVHSDSYLFDGEYYIQIIVHSTDGEGTTENPLQIDLKGFLEVIDDEIECITIEKKFWGGFND